jgi:pyruvate-ferredoxin/flavodoxin oxidoreductase
MKDACPDMAVVDANGKSLAGLKYRMQVSPLDCTGCGNCVDVCPAPKKALEMQLLESQMHEDKHWDWISKNVSYKDTLLNKEQSVKNSQFAQPLFEFSGACAGCGETPYIKLITQLYGERMMIANATGCSSIYGGSAPATPYTVNENGHGPAWANSLFEDNAEYGFGMATGVNKLRQRIARLMEAGLESELSDKTKDAFRAWLAVVNDGKKSKDASADVIASIEKETIP